MTVTDNKAGAAAAHHITGPLTASPGQGGPLLNSAEVATLIRVPEATLRYWRHVGIGPKSFKMGPRRVLYLAADVTAWVADQYDSPR